ncbi:S9 family peptidase [Pseudomonas syringae group genomosp. 3]|uniref:S9 family peptidase n=1 Tax=Pseudomonas syringae group genomosp. 3 TaxID=251701 RepID=UPI0006E66088|nr:S9 family peptidase [Pseudomonas syringae group genomosp. 3]KPY08469.1 Peptidase S9, prolyl oligopeptidase active site region [Pseudomonas syringae pv. philadelphi]RMM21499.1 Peptidase S9, prolyl oligopeptidase active site region [Pseudomonas syringae pv. berberidis]
MTETHASSQNLPDTLTAAQAVAAGVDFAELDVSSAGLFWNEYRPEDGACRIWHWYANSKRCLTPQGFSVRSRVYEYGGGSFCLADDAVVFVNERDQQLYRQALDASVPVALTQGDKRYGGVFFSNGQVLAVEEDHNTHRLVAINLADGQRVLLAEGADFYASPIVSANGKRLAWIEWQRPHQPWTRSRLMCAAKQDDGQWGVAVCIAGDGAEESLQQPRFDARSRLYCLTDRAGFWQPWGETPSGFAALPAASADHASAPWQLGSCTWLPINDGYLASWSQDGSGVLGLCQADGSTEDFSVGYSRFRSLAVDEEFVYCIAASAVSTAAVLAISRADHSVHVLAGGGSPLPAELISRPQALCYPSGGAEAYGYFYPAMTGAQKPPLVVFIHGGPTSACYPVLDPRIQYWTHRGFAVADLNYRGSSGYGRAYRQGLHLTWGVADVQDACAVVTHLAERGLIDEQQAFIRGGSAGGYTTLCALAFEDVFRAGASLYGVSDPVALAKATHKLEGDYLDWLIGDPVTDIERYEARTPLLHANLISVPVIFFQGELDAVVVPEQTRAMLKALQDNGIKTEGHFYPDEHHGFRKAHNQADALEKEWRFYREVLDQAV